MSRNNSVTYPAYQAVPQDGEDVSLSDDNTYSNVAGFMVDSDGTLAVTMNGGGSMSLPVKAGVQYVGNVRKFLATGSSGVTTVNIFY